MNEFITSEVLDDFYHITQYDIRSFVSKYVQFIDEQYSDIINYFSGSSDVVPTKSFDSLKILREDYERIVSIIIGSGQSLSNYKYWILVEYIEDIGLTLDTAFNASKWLRSSSVVGTYRNSIRNEVMISQGETLEDVERNKINSSQPQESWVDTAIQNNLTEEDYDSTGGVLIKGILQGGSNIILNGIVDNIDTPEKTYGLDIDRNITIEDNDVKVLSYKDTILQCAEILTSLKQGDDPSFINRGLSKALIGSNVASITYPSIFRQLLGNFSTDDSFKSISISDIKRQQDGVFIEVLIETKAGTAFNNLVQL